MILNNNDDEKDKIVIEIGKSENKYNEFQYKKIESKNKIKIYKVTK